MANVTGDKDSEAQSKLESQRRRNPENAPVEEVVTTSSANNNKAKIRKDKKKDRGKALVRSLLPPMRLSQNR